MGDGICISGQENMFQKLRYGYNYNYDKYYNLCFKIDGGPQPDLFYWKDVCKDVLQQMWATSMMDGWR